MRDGHFRCPCLEETLLMVVFRIKAGFFLKAAGICHLMEKHKSRLLYPQKYLLANVRPFDKIGFCGSPYFGRSG